ncbi:MAG: membrane protein insertion efficiency factor YidD [Bacteroidota bacterium]|nr:membrane protein insertion efficiency factor YidD [Bacteroidota bacterium]MDP4205974.1 membrane protein insertion efficiency factor YidD [Bacteroidota bacterium]
MGRIRKILIFLLSLPVHFYRYAISPLKPPSCRHYPTCSEYALQALKIHGPVKGLILATWRILRCNPWGTSGYDPVPPRKVKTSRRSKT